MGILSRAKVRLALALRRLLQRPVDLCYPLDGFRGWFPDAFRRKPPEVHYVGQMVEHLRREHVCFDVGAHIGYYTLLFARHAREVHAFEPLPANLALLRKNVALNRLGNVHVHELAVGGGTGTVRLGAGLGPDSMASVLRDDAATCVEVPATDLDSFCAERRVYPDLVKIDVEGYEAHVLEGMAAVLARTAPILFLELHASYLGARQIDTLLGSLRDRGYRVFSWLEDVEPGGHGFWRGLVEVESAADLRVGATLALPPAKLGAPPS